jgi:hypothetical protein
MTWNYRVLRTIINGEETFAIHEVYYDKNGNPDSCTKRASEPFGENLKELRSDMDRMLEAFSQPVLEYSMFCSKEANKNG